jgi:hypothetical protein
VPADQLFTDWLTGDVVTATKLNQMKNDLAALTGAVFTGDVDLDKASGLLRLGTSSGASGTPALQFRDDGNLRVTMEYEDGTDELSFTDQGTTLMMKMDRTDRSATFGGNVILEHPFNGLIGRGVSNDALVLAGDPITTSGARIDLRGGAAVNLYGSLVYGNVEALRWGNLGPTVPAGVNLELASGVKLTSGGKPVATNFFDPAAAAWASAISISVAVDADDTSPTTGNFRVGRGAATPAGGGWVDYLRLDSPTEGMQLYGGPAILGFYTFRISSDGTIKDLPAGWSANRPSSGNYDVTHNLGDTSYVCVVTSSQHTADINQRASNTVSIETRNASGTLVDGAVYGIVIHGGGA